MDIVFTGSEADDHEIEAYSGVVSLEGIARAANLAAHYAATGEVRFRAPYSDEVEFRISAPTEGSLSFPFKAVSRVSGAIAKKKLAGALLLALLSRSTGQEIPEEISSQISNVRSGDLDAMAEGATPGVLRAHRWIDNDKKSIDIAGGEFSGVSFDQETKEYLEIEECSDETTQDVTVAAVNANSKIGRVYFDNLGRTVPFKVGKDATGRTLSNLSRYLTRHIEKTNEWVSIRFIPIRYSDGRLKRIIILDCALASELG
jgi:hypothetical protein